MITTLRDEMYRARWPWETADADSIPVCAEQDSIDRCLCCSHPSAACDYCDGRGNVKMPKRLDNLDQLRELMQLRVCPTEMARTLRVSRNTVYRMMSKLQTQNS